MHGSLDWSFAHMGPLFINSTLSHYPCANSLFVPYDLGWTSFAHAIFSSISPAHLQGLLHQNYQHAHIGFGTGFMPDALSDATQHCVGTHTRTHSYSQFGMSNRPNLDVFGL